jgi:hypothetical protein
MRKLLAAGAVAAALGAAGTASAGLIFVNLAINNPSLDPWSAIEFRVVPVEGVDYDPSFSDQVRFPDNANLFTTTKAFATPVLQSETSVRYDFASFAPMLVGDTETFTLAIEISSLAPFKIQQYFVAVPTPGSGVLAGLALVCGMLPRRRRSA